MTDKPYPKPAELALQTAECRIPPEFLPHPDEPTLKFEPKVAEYRFLTIRPNESNNTSGLRNYDFISYEGRDVQLNSEKDVQRILNIILRKKKTLKIIFENLPVRKMTLDNELDTSVFEDHNIVNQLQLSHGLVESKTPYDINVTEQCYVVLLLDPRVNWRFTSGGRGVTTKAFHGTDNFGVRFVTRSEPEKCESAVTYSNPNNHFGAPIDCTVLYFSVARRRHDAIPPQEGYSSKQSFNFHLEFVWPEEFIFFGKENDNRSDIKLWKYYPARTMPTIFDPDVPNSGGASLP